MAHGFFYDNRNGRIVMLATAALPSCFTRNSICCPRRAWGFSTLQQPQARERGLQLEKDSIRRLHGSLLPGAGSYVRPAHSRPPRRATLLGSPDVTSSRRVEHGFLSVFYLLQQSAITANPDGTSSGRRGASNPAGVTFHEVGPDLPASRRRALTSYGCLAVWMVAENRHRQRGADSGSQAVPAGCDSASVPDLTLLLLLRHSGRCRDRVAGFLDREAPSGCAGRRLSRAAPLAISHAYRSHLRCDLSSGLDDAPEAGAQH